jgi:hypothetical protein
MPLGGGGNDFVQKNNYLPPQLLNFFNDQQAHNDLAATVNSQIKGTDYSTEIQALQGTQKTRADEASKNTAVSDYLGNLKGELAKGTDQYIQAQQDASNNQLQTETLPSLAQNLNSRGLLFSGDLPSSAASAYSSAQGNIESQYADMMNQDLAFYENAAYADQLKKSLVSGGDYASQLQAQEAQALQDQQNRFSTNETKLSQQGKLDLARQQGRLSRPRFRQFAPFIPTRKGYGGGGLIPGINGGYGD